MADNIDITPGSGATVATDEVAGRHIQIVKPAFGADGAATLVDASNGMPVAVVGTIDADVAGTVAVSGGTVNVGNLPATQIVTGGVVIGAGSAIIGTVAIAGASSVTLGAGSAQIGTVNGSTVSLSGTSTISGAVTLAAGSSQIGTVNGSTVSLSGTSAIAGTVNLAGAIPAGSNTIGTVSLATGGTVAVTGGLTNAELRATPVPISGTTTLASGATVSLAGTSTIAGAVSVSAGTVTLAAGANTIGTVSVGNFPTTQTIAGAVSGTVNLAGAIPAGANTIGTVVLGAGGTVAVTGALSDTELRATPVPVSGTVTLAGGAGGGLTDAELRATPVPVEVSGGTLSLDSAVVIGDVGVGELMETMRAIQVGINGLRATVGASIPDASGRMRVSLDAAGGAQTLGTVTTVTTVTTCSTVTNVTTVATVSTLTNQAQMGGFAANEQIPALMMAAAQGLRRNIVVA
jgi:fibronectin-binding autotransporter adhesin